MFLVEDELRVFTFKESGELSATMICCDFLKTARLILGRI